MLGSFRFLLAWTVMLSHMPFSPFPIYFNPAVSAVIMFYFISGYLMYKSFEKETNKKIPFKKQVLYFFIKRILRLLPLYLLVLFLTTVSIWYFGRSEFITLLNQDLSFKKIFLNILLIFNNYVFNPFTISSLLPHPLIPPTWSLSTEWHFYLLVPILFVLLKKNSKWFYVIFVISFLFELTAFSFTYPHFNSDNFGYRYIFGVLWIFMFGFLYSKNSNSLFFKTIYLFIICYYLFIGFYFFNHPYVKEITIALLFLPLIKTIMNIKFKHDHFFGKLSYPIFLSHFFVFYFVEKVFGLKNKIVYFIEVFVIVLLFSYVLSKVQDKIDLARKKF